MHRYSAPPNSLFRRNREHFMRRMVPGTAALLFSNQRVNVNADAHYTFEQDSNFYYLTGIDQEECSLLLWPDAPEEQYQAVLFIRETSEQLKVWEGEKYTPEQAREASGIDTIRYQKNFSTQLRSVLKAVDGFYLDFNEHLRNSDFTYSAAHRFADYLKQQYPGHKIHRAAPLLEQLRMLKSAAEIDQMRTACEITGSTFDRILAVMQPGCYEFEIEAEIRKQFIAQRSEGPAYAPIVAGGGNACILHYTVNKEQIQDGDLVLMDFGANYGNYASDLTRTIPANGRFTQRQREVYNAVLHVQRSAMDLLRPGKPFKEYNEAVGELMDEQLLKLGLLNQSDIDDQDPDWPARKQFFPHGVSHYIGLDTHDVGDMTATFQPGMVFTVEPGIYIPDEGIGIRLENDVLVTENEPHDLMHFIPIEAEAIEGLMNQYRERS